MSMESNDPCDSLGSFRDPAGQLFDVDGRLLRVVYEPHAAEVTTCLQSPALQRFSEQGRLVATHPVVGETAEALIRRRARLSTRDGKVAMVLEHERIFFRSHPSEWPVEMLHAAGLLTIELAEALLDEGLGLKDARPQNVLFDGPRPIFVDYLSIERRDPKSPIWVPFGQFSRNFLLPLLVHQRFGLPLHEIFLGHPDGLEPAQVYPMCGPIQRLLPPFLSLVAMPYWLEMNEKKKRRNESRDAFPMRTGHCDPEKAAFVLRAQFRRWRRLLDRMGPRPKRSSYWSSYFSGLLPYSESQFQEKEKFVGTALDSFRPKAVLDVGCNTGKFSLMAAAAGARVVAIDTDPVAVGKTWMDARDRKASVLPLVVNLASPSPALGWRNREHPGFLERARGKFDLVMMLGILHHLLVTDRIPLGEIVRLAADLSSDYWLVEHVGESDPSVRSFHLTAALPDLSTATFEKQCEPYFSLVRKQTLTASPRTLYLLRKKENIRA